MRRFIQNLPYGALAPTRPIWPTFRSRPGHYSPSTRNLSSSHTRGTGEHAKQAKDINQKGADEQEGQLDKAIGQAKDLQARTPWHRQGSDEPPVKRMRSAGAMTKGKLLTTPSRLLKLILPLTTLDKNSDRKSIEPLALLVHPQQPLSYLERLIQSELPLIKEKDGSEKVPEVHFRAEDSASDEIKADLPEQDEEQTEDAMQQGSDEQMVDGKLIKLGKISEKAKDLDRGEAKSQDGIAQSLRGGPGEGGIESYSGRGREATESQPKRLVRWSSSTEIGDFIRDAARGKEFAVEIEGSSAPTQEIMVGVPSFNDRTHYLRVRLRKTSRNLMDYAKIKKECDQIAHKSAQRLAMAGFGILMSWWGAIYYFTFLTDYGWDTMEPITYLAGLSTLMLGYLWFLWHNREVSYRSALNLTVSRRQNTLYEQRGFDPHKWEALVQEANALRKEIKVVAEEYDVEWDEKQDEVSEEVHDAMREERDKRKKNDDREDEDDDEKKKKKKKG